MKAAVQFAPNDATRARAYFIMGNALVMQGEQKKERYQDAERALREALRLAPEENNIRFALGRALLKMSRDEDGIAELKQYLANDPKAYYARVASRYIENPRRARELFIPQFTLTTLDGQYRSSEDLVGKVVVFDFWATWCGPCRMAIGELRELAKKFRNEPVVVLSISADSNEGTLRKFIQSEKMDWPQYWDRDHRLRSLFGVNAFPTYLVVDQEGIMRKLQTGAGGFQLDVVEGQIKKLLKQARKQEPATQN